MKFRTQLFWLEEQMRAATAEQDSLFKFVTSILEAGYFLLVSLRALIYRLGLKQPNRLPGITVSIGNLVVGGTGKSPLVISLCNYLSAKAQRPVVLSRGYGSGLRSGEVAVFLDGVCIDASRGSELFADEARMISANCEATPVVVGRNRYHAASYYLQKSLGASLQPTHWILDDGFQHRQVHRDLDYLVVSSQDPFGNHHLLPRGILREPVSALKRSSRLLVVNATADSIQNLKDELALFDIENWPMSSISVKGYRLKQVTMLETSFVVESLKFAALVGIANPLRFFNDLGALGAHIQTREVIADHRRFDVSRVEQIILGCDAVVTTSKDYWREPEIFNKIKLPCFLLELAVDGTSWQELAKFE